MPQTRNTKIALSGLLALSLLTFAPAQAQPYQIKGLVEVKKHKREKWWHLRGPRTYVYALDGTDKTAEMHHRIKSLPDLRDREAIKAKLAKLQSKAREKVIFYLPLLQLGWGAYMTFKKGSSI